MYPSFVETYLAIRPMYWARLIGGLLYLAGFILMAWNLIKTARSGEARRRRPIEVAVEDRAARKERGALAEAPLRRPPVMASIIVIALFSCARRSSSGTRQHHRSRPDRSP